MKTAVVLSGGGSKGSYQLGVWKALRDLHIKVELKKETSSALFNSTDSTEKP